MWGRDQNRARHGNPGNLLPEVLEIYSLKVEKIDIVFVTLGGMLACLRALGVVGRVGEDVETLVQHVAVGGGVGPQHGDEGVLVRLGYCDLHLVPEDVPKSKDDASADADELGVGCPSFPLPTFYQTSKVELLINVLCNLQCSQQVCTESF